MAENDRSDPVSDITTRILNGRPPDGDEADGYTEEEYFDRYWDLGDAKPGTIRCLRLHHRPPPRRHHRDRRPRMARDPQRRLDDHRRCSRP